MTRGLHTRQGRAGPFHVLRWFNVSEWRGMPTGEDSHGAPPSIVNKGNTEGDGDSDGAPHHSLSFNWADCHQTAGEVASGRLRPQCSLLGKHPRFALRRGKSWAATEADLVWDLGSLGRGSWNAWVERTQNHKEQKCIAPLICWGYTPKTPEDA
jgi:hypothetical protein